VTLEITYHSPTTPGNPGFSVTFGPAVRLGDIPGLSTEAELGAVGTSALRFDDPDGTAGNDGDAIKGLKQISVTESEAPSGNRRIGEYYIGDRRYYRGTQGSSPSLRTGAARVIDMTLTDINSFLSFRVFRADTNGSNTSFNRPAETDIERVTAMLAVSFISDTLFNGLVSSSNPVDMDANDYTGSTPADVLNDCAQQSGKNFFVFYDESGTYTPDPGDYGLFYDFNDSMVYLSTMQVSNDLDDVDNSTTWAPWQDSVLTRDPSRVAAGVFMPNGSNSIYVEQPSTAYAYEWRDFVSSSPSLHTIPEMTARANRYLIENSTEDDRLQFTIQVPPPHVNDWKEGQAAQVKFTHLPGYEDFRYVRCLTRTVMAPDEGKPGPDQSTTGPLYQIHYECTPLVSQPSGAFDAQVVGNPYSGIPTLPKPTTPGNVLFAIMFAAGNTVEFPTSFRALDSPPIYPASPAVPPYSALQTAAWTVLVTATTDYSGQNIGGPCSELYQGPFHGGAGNCTSGLMIAMAYRMVAPGEVTTTPSAFSTEILHSNVSVYLWELPTSIPPTTGVESDGQGVNPCVSTMPSVSGNAVAAFMYALAAGHSAIANPIASSVASPGAALREAWQVAGSIGSSNENKPDLVTANSQNWGQVILLTAGGIPSGTVTPGGGSAYVHLNWCGASCILPPGIVLPDIPFPANQS
jgi:hypothetical protein